MSFPSQHQLGWLFGSNLVGRIGDWLFSLNGVTCWLAVKHGKHCGAHLHTPPQKAKCRLVLVLLDNGVGVMRGDYDYDCNSESGDGKGWKPREH
jgi:hypothetical protein